MPRTPITIRVVPSRLAWGCHGLLGAAVTALLVAYAPAWLSLGGGLGVAALLVWLSSRDHGGELCWLPGDEAQGGWRWRPGRDARARAVELHCVYLGPWLVGLRLGRHPLWLWPDSSDGESLRQLRRWLVQHG